MNFPIKPRHRPKNNSAQTHVQNRPINSPWRD